MIIVRFSPRASEGIEDATRYYRRLDQKLAQRFVAALHVAVQQIQEAPRRWAVWRDPDFRRVLVQTFPDSLFYCVVSEAEIFVAAFVHQRQEAEAIVTRESAEAPLRSERA